MYGDSAEAERSAVADVVGALEAAVAAGQIRFYGFCNFGDPPTRSLARANSRLRAGS